METIHFHINRIDYIFDYFVFKFSKFKNLKSFIMKNSLEKYNRLYTKMLREKPFIQNYTILEALQLRKKIKPIERLMLYVSKKTNGNFFEIERILQLITEMNYLLDIQINPNPRKGWAEAFKEMHANGDDKLLVPELHDNYTKEWAWQ